MNDCVNQIASLLESGRDPQTVLPESLQLMLTALHSETGAFTGSTLNGSCFT